MSRWPPRRRRDHPTELVVEICGSYREAQGRRDDWAAILRKFDLTRQLGVRVEIRAGAYAVVMQRHDNKPIDETAVHLTPEEEDDDEEQEGEP